MENEKYVFIYALIDPLDNDIRYIGKTNNVKRRLMRHIQDSKFLDSYKDRWVRFLKKEGRNPEIIIIDEVLVNDWVISEQYWISQFKSWGFKLTNGTDGGDQPPSNIGRKHREESKIKMSKSKIGKPIPWLNTGLERSEEHKLNLSNSLKGRISEKKNKCYIEIYGEENGLALKNKLSNSHKGIQSGENHPMYGKHHTNETKEKLTKHFSKKVIQLSLNGEIVKVWDSIKSAKEELKINHISSCCSGKLKTCGGYKWKYYE